MPKNWFFYLSFLIVFGHFNFVSCDLLPKVFRKSSEKYLFKISVNTLFQLKIISILDKPTKLLSVLSLRQTYQRSLNKYSYIKYI